jgi:hypothetical protein
MYTLAIQIFPGHRMTNWGAIFSMRTIRDRYLDNISEQPIRMVANTQDYSDYHIDNTNELYVGSAPP